MKREKGLTDKANTICLYKILEKYSDEDHTLSMSEIIKRFSDDYGMTIDRRTVYSSIETLRLLGYEVSEYDKRTQGYYLMSRLFEPSEIRLMMDAVYSQKSIPNRQTGDLIEKLQACLSDNQKRHYKHLFAIDSDKKTQNLSVFYNIDVLDEAISRRKKVAFTYLQYGLDKRLRPRRSDKYVVSPYGMVCDNQNYYLICTKESKEGLSYYRIDLMKDIAVLDKPAEQAKADINTAKKTVYAFAGQPVEIKLKCRNSVIGGVIDEFGTGVQIVPGGGDFFIARLKSAPQGLLYWTMQYIGDIEILEPADLREKAIEMIKNNLYGI